MYYTHLIESCVNGSYYIGHSSNLDKRLKLHNSGSVTSTKRYKPWKLAAFLPAQSKQSAIKTELHLKSLKSRNRVLEYFKLHSST